MNTWYSQRKLDNLHYSVGIAKEILRKSQQNLKSAIRERDAAAEYAENPGKPGTWKLILGVAIFGAFIALLVLILVHVLPISYVGLGILVAAVGSVFIGWYANDRTNITDRFNALDRAEAWVEKVEDWVIRDEQYLATSERKLRDEETFQRRYRGLIMAAGAFVDLF
ncbi:hypothetical protein [Leifsonia sp. Leaf264]|uniref:hypothetical protein n=1 Tax=Leifsonia sp. Leaf264 TaxID=1736314 RepID=UPI0006F35BCE|nr:hypothetical protein [Leifsonia sp. Leaf264]KQO98293.1 hypothetical protein ASF30_09545 [Leifsonia sp. Leaf264]